MRVVYLSEGDPESRASWSGISKSVVDEFRLRGHEVVTGDADLRGVPRYAAALATFSPDRERWGVRYRLGAVPFALRSRRAESILRRHEVTESCVVLQAGATFHPRPGLRIPRFLYCDSNIYQAILNRASSQSPASRLSRGELDAIVARERAVYVDATAIFTICERLRASFLEDAGIPRERVHTVYAGPNFDEQALKRIDKADTLHERRQAEIPTILFVGAQFRRKGGDLLVEAFQQLRDQLPTARLEIIGSDIRLDVPGVVVHGYIDKDTASGWEQLVGAYRRAHVFCLPSRYEPFGIAFVEAMHFGIPCIGTTVWAIPEIIVDGETGFIVQPDDARTLADRLLRLLESPELTRSMGRAGLERARAMFSWRRVVDRMLSVVATVEGLAPVTAHQ